MIHGINNQYPQNPYVKGTTGKKKTEEKAPAFLLDYDDNGVVWERSEEKKEGFKEKEISKAKEERKATDITARRETEKKPGNSKQEWQAEDGLKEIKNTANQIWQGIKNAFQKLLQIFWYEEEPTKEKETAKILKGTQEASKAEAAEKNEEKVQKTEGVMQQAGEENATPILTEKEKDERIKELIQKKDTEGMMRLLTDNHTRHVAKNSSLLSYYDRHGKMVSVPASEQDKILYGDTRKKNYREKV